MQIIKIQHNLAQFKAILQFSIQRGMKDKPEGFSPF